MSDENIQEAQRLVLKGRILTKVANMKNLEKLQNALQCIEKITLSRPSRPPSTVAELTPLEKLEAQYKADSQRITDAILVPVSKKIKEQAALRKEFEEKKKRLPSRPKRARVDLRVRRGVLG
jgi:hypothetical protein